MGGERRGIGWLREIVRHTGRVLMRVGLRKKEPTKKKSYAVDQFPNRSHFVLEQARRAKTGKGNPKKTTVTELELASARLIPEFQDLIDRYESPPETVAFVSVVNALYFRGLEGLLLSLVETYPSMKSPYLVYHDGTLSEFAQHRLLEIYPHCAFREGNMPWFRHELDQTHNHRRIGKLGFLNTLALELRSYEHVIVLDADLLILGDISELWQHSDCFMGGYCFGDREYCAISARTGRGIINSGVVSIPAKFLTDDSTSEMRRILEHIEEPACPLLDRFADQKAWNLFLADKPVQMLPYNYNCNIKQLAQMHGGTLEGIRILHYVGPKPWLASEYVTREDSKTPQMSSLTYHTPWRTTYRELLYKKRLGAYLGELPKMRNKPVLGARAVLPDTCVIIGNGPSIAQTDLLRLRGVEKICFNWFIHHKDFDQVAPEHLVLASHFFFGGWNTLAPKFPQDFLGLLRAKRHKPVIWAPYYFKWVFEQEGLLGEYECNFVLFEQPFKKHVERCGYARTNLNGFLMDGRTALISVAIPVAGHLGFKRLVMVGCDSNYQQASSPSDYFYAREAHTTESNSAELLRAIWSPDGQGPFAYQIMEQRLRAEGKSLVDATIGGALTTVPKLAFEALLAEVSRSERQQVP